MLLFGKNSCFLLVTCTYLCSIILPCYISIFQTLPRNLWDGEVHTCLLYTVCPEAEGCCYWTWTSDQFGSWKATCVEANTGGSLWNKQLKWTRLAYAIVVLLFPKVKLKYHQDNVIEPPLFAFYLFYRVSVRHHQRADNSNHGLIEKVYSGIIVQQTL